FGRLLGLVWYYVIPIRRGVAMQNVRRVFGDTMSRSEQRRLVRRCFQQQMMAGMEVLRAPLMTEELSIELVERQGFEHIEEAVARGKGLIGVLVHMGNVDMIGFSQAIRGLPLYGVVREIKGKSAQKFITRVRTRTGMQLIPPRRSAERIRQVLAGNGMVGMIVDQHMPKHRGIVCVLFNMLASTSPAPARFGFDSGTTILPMVMFRKGMTEKFVLRIGPPFELEAPHDDLQENIRHNTERLNRIIEGWIREAPEQWFWVHRRWKVQDDPSRWDIPQHLQHLAESPAAAT
ncbi:MAG: lysophospholipid acyltransferase family protein, partial [Myxococcota bacterium]